MKNNIMSKIISVLVAVVYFGSSYLTLDSNHNWGGDFAQYIAHTKNIVEGMSYSQTNYVFNEENPFVGPPSYPPGTSFLLVPSYYLFGLDFLALKATLLFSFTVAMLLLYLYLVKFYEVGLAALTIFCVAYNPYIWSFRQQILSDFPFIMWVFISLFCVHKLLNENNFSYKRLISVFAGVALYMAFATRVLGLLVIPAVICYLIFNNFKRGKHLLVSLIIFLLLVAIQFAMIGNTYDYSDAATSSSIFNVSGNLLIYSQGMTQLFIYPFWSSNKFILAFLPLVSLAGFVATKYNQAKPLGRGGLFVRILKSFQVHEWMLGGYLVIILTQPFSQSPRYLLPWIPFFILYTLLFIKIIYNWVSARINLPKFLNLKLISCLFVATFISLFVLLEFSNKVEGFKKEPSIITPESIELFQFVQNELSEDALIAFSKPRVMGLLGDRRSIILPSDINEVKIHSYFISKKISHLVVAYPKLQLELPFSYAIFKDIEGLNQIFENDDFFILEVEAVAS